MPRISASVAGSAISASMSASSVIGGAIGFHGVDQRIELGELARDLHIFLGAHLAEQLGFEGSVVRKQDVEFGFGEHRHR